ncbi:hypothetical protein GM708_06400 [Vibrio cholerae]|nr:hypothetical protein [Vibrio cholerae]
MAAFMPITTTNPATALHHYAGHNCCREAGVDAFLHKVAFEIGRSGEDVEDQPAAGDVVLIISCKDRNPIPFTGQLCQLVDEVTDRPTREGHSAAGKLLSPTRPG